MILEKLGLGKLLKNLDNLNIKYSGIKDIAESSILEKMVKNLDLFPLLQIQPL